MAKSTSAAIRVRSTTILNSKLQGIIWIGLIGISVLSLWLSAKTANDSILTTTASTMEKQLREVFQGVPSFNDQLPGSKDDDAHNGIQQRLETNNALRRISGKADHAVSGLSCTDHGGPNDDRQAQEMVYWRDIPSDADYVSPFYHQQSSRQGFLTFEPDEGGWNNIRMAWETVLGLAVAMGRTLVLPPEKKMYLLSNEKSKTGKQQQKHFGFEDFFHMDSIHREHETLDVITMEKFLQEYGLTGKLLDPDTGKSSFPPLNRTDWGGVDRRKQDPLYDWLRRIGMMVTWRPEKCKVIFPASTDHKNLQAIADLHQQIVTGTDGPPKWEDFVGKPVPVNASAADRLKEHWAGRNEMCLYDSALQEAPLLHFPLSTKMNARLLTHFYAFLFFEDWHVDLWMKRFIRDHVRYTDEIQCAAARVVQSMRKLAQSQDPVNNPSGAFDTLHVRRGDFQYKKTRVDAKEILKMTKRKLASKATVFIATDERDKSFFKPLQEEYHVYFLDDFLDVIGPDVNSNFYGMIDQLVAARGRIFFGCWFSSFTGYINRLRGYFSTKEGLPGAEDGIIASYYYILADRYDHMQTYYPVKQMFYAREFPVSWRNIDFDVQSIEDSKQRRMKDDRDAADI